jgi:TIR domain
MAQRIFISYRRDDSRGYAGRLQGDLSRRYSEEHVFRDIEIPPGADFGEYITSLVDKCNVVLAIIGPGWLDARDRDGERRLDDPQDWVRLEIERALAREGVEVIPVLVDGARLPPREELPPSMLALRRRNAFELSDRRWDYDLEQLGTHLDTLLQGTSALHLRPAGLPSQGPPVSAARERAEGFKPGPWPEPVPPTTTTTTTETTPPADHTGSAVLAAAAVALLTAFPADLIAHNLVDRAPLDRDDLQTVRDFVLEKAIFFGIAGALAALAVGFLSRRSREPLVSFLLGLGAGVVAGAVYAGAYAGLTFSAEGTDTASTAVGMIAAGAFLGWAFGAERAGARLEASCAGLAGGLLAAGVVGLLHESLTTAAGHRLLSGLCIAVIVAAAGFVGLRVPRSSTAPAAELLTRARAAPPAMHR